MYQNEANNKKRNKERALTREISGKILVEKKISIKRNDRESQRIVLVYKKT
jgi:ribosomal protein S28E/S33